MESLKQSKLGKKLHLAVAAVAAFLLSAIILSHSFEQSTSWISFGSEKGVPRKEVQQYKDELELALDGVSMRNKTLIITILNKAYANESGMLDLFLRGFRQGENTTYLLHHILFVAVDMVAYDRCSGLNLHCYKLVTEGVDFSREEIYMSKDFINMMWRRTLFMSEVLRRGYSFIFTDMDVVWLRDPFPRLGREGEDLQISCDWYNGSPFDPYSNGLNTGFFFAAATNRTIALFDAWYGARLTAEGKKDQDVLGSLKNNGTFTRLDLKVRFLDPRYFAGFCVNYKGLGEVRTFHANCCVGIKAKMADLTLLLDEWGAYNGSDNGLHFWEARSCSMSWVQKLGDERTDR